ncbi:MAG: hypothetical protein AAF638_10445 [Pseudomonadota bacterium]
MSLIGDGRTAIRAMLDEANAFAGIPDRDWSSAAIRLAKKQLTAARQTRDDIVSVKTALGDDMFERALDALTAYHVKLLAKRVDPTVDSDTIETASMARTHIRTVLTPDWVQPADLGDSPDEEQVEPEKPKSNPYIGRKAFRTGR